MKKNNLKIDDSVKVKNGILCPDLKDFCTADEVELMQARDKEEDVEEVIEKISKTHAWGYLGEVGKRIQKVLVNGDDEMAAFKAWENYLAKKLTFPFDAIITGGPDKGPLKPGDKVSVKRISLVEDFYGIFVELRRGSNKYDHPLSGLEVSDGELSNFQAVNDYSTWFANHE